MARSEVARGGWPAKVNRPVSTTAEFEAEWKRSRPSKLPWILLVAAVVVAGWSSCTLKGAKDEAEAALRKESERSAALETKVKDLAKTQATHGDEDP